MWKLSKDPKNIFSHPPNERGWGCQKKSMSPPPPRCKIILLFAKQNQICLRSFKDFRIIHIEIRSQNRFRHSPAALCHPPPRAAASGRFLQDQIEGEKVSWEPPSNRGGGSWGYPLPPCAAWVEGRGSGGGFPPSGAFCVPINPCPVNAWAHRPPQVVQTGRWAHQK